MARDRVTVVSKSGRNGPKNSQVAPKLGRIEEEGGRIAGTISTKDIIALLGDIATMGLSGLGQKGKTNSGLNIGRNWTQTNRRGEVIVLSAYKAKCPRARERARRAPLSKMESTKFVGIQKSPPTTNSPLFPKYSRSLLKRGS